MALVVAACLSAASTRSRMAADEIPCASGVLRGNAVEEFLADREITLWTKSVIIMSFFMFASRAHDICLFPRGKHVCPRLNSLCRRSSHWSFPIRDEVRETVRLLLAAKPDTLDLDWWSARMKITDDYGAKYRIWAEKLQVAPASAPVRIPNFRSRRFSSHAEMNAWKESLLREFARVAPGK